MLDFSFTIKSYQLKELILDADSIDALHTDM
jgi:hypothetical protein